MVDTSTTGMIDTTMTGMIDTSTDDMSAFVGTNTAGLLDSNKASKVETSDFPTKTRETSAFQIEPTSTEKVKTPLLKMAPDGTPIFTTMD